MVRVVFLGDLAVRSPQSVCERRVPRVRPFTRQSATLTSMEKGRAGN